MTEGSTTGPVVGERFAGYVVREQIGSGAVAAIYRADRGPGSREVALKVAHVALASRSDVATRFEREAKIISRLGHPLCVRLFDWGVAHGLPYVAVELVRGIDFAQLLAGRGRLEARFSVRVAIELCDLLRVAHTAGIVHRDLRPAKLMLAGPSSAETTTMARPPIKVLDFGVAAGESGGAGGTPTTAAESAAGAGPASGLRAHLAPELAAGATFDGRADLFSCGVLLYQFLTGELPFEGPAGSSTAQSPAAPSQIVPGLSTALDTIVLQCLRPRPEERPRTAFELGRVLASVEPSLTP